MEEAVHPEDPDVFVPSFLLNTDKEVIFDLPKLYNTRYKIKKFNYSKPRMKNNKIWATVFPTSAISLRRDFLIYCYKNFLKNKFKMLEIDFRICVFSFNIFNNFYILNKELTNYRQTNSGIISHYPKFRIKWW